MSLSKKSRADKADKVWLAQLKKNYKKMNKAQRLKALLK